MSSKSKVAPRVGRTRRLLCGASLSVLALVGVAPAAWAQDATRYWDANAAQPTGGGSGTWDTTSHVWSESNSDVLGPYHGWNNAGLDNAIFGSVPAGTTSVVGTIGLTTPITVHNMTFQTFNGWTLNGGTLTLGGATPTISTVTNTTINSVLAGTAGLTKTGVAQLWLTGANTFSGGITLGAGSLRVTNDAVLGAASNGVTTTANASFTVDSGTTNRTVTIGAGTTLTVGGAGVGSALYTGGGGLSVLSGVRLTNDANTYTGPTRLNGVSQGSGNVFFSSVRNLGEASSLGAPTDAVNGTITFGGGSQYSDNIIYTGDGDSSNRNWLLSGSTSRVFRQRGTGTLTLTGDISVTPTSFIAETADFELLGVISGSGNVGFGASAAGSITLGGANTFTGNAGVSGGLVRASVLADGGLASSLGAGPTLSLGSLGLLSYTGTGNSSNRAWSSDGATSILNDGTGALTLSGNLAFNAAGSTDTLTLGGSYAGTNIFSGAISGAGNLASSGSGTWVLGGANTRTGTVTVSGGTLRAGSASALGTTTGVTVTSGVLDLNGFSLNTPVLHGTGGSIALGSNPATILTIDGATASDYAGAITGAGGLTKLGTSTLTLTGANTYTGPTTIGGGTLALNFAGAGAPTNNIIASGSSLNLTGGTLKVTGAAGVANAQTFAGTTISAGANTVQAVSGTGGGMTLDLGAVSRTSGLINFILPASGRIRTSSTALGGWATINGTDYAKVVAGDILPFVDADYTDQDNVAQWAAGQFISDSDGDGLSYSGTLASSMQLGGLQFTEAASSNIALGGQTLGVDGAIIVAPSVGGAGQTISGGNLTGASGGVLGIQQNGTGVFSVGATIVDNGGPTGFTKGGAGTVRLTGANTYTGVTTLSAGRLEINSLANGGASSSIGQSGAGSGNLVLQGGTLAWVGGTDPVTNRGFTLVNGGAGDPTIEVGSPRTVEFAGLVTSPDDAGLTKTGWGTLVLSNPANDYIGVTKITGSGGSGSNSSTLSVNKLANGGQVSGIGKSSAVSSNLVLESGGQLLYTGATDSTNRGFTLASGGRIGVSQAATTLTVSGVAVGAGGLIKEGDGTLVLSGTNTYGGGTTVNGGKLVAGSNQAFGGAASGAGAGRLTVNAPASVDLGAFDVFVGGLQGDGNVIVGAGGALQSNGTGTFTGGIGGAGEVKLTAGTQIMTGCNNTYAGPTTIQSSTLSTDCLADGLQASGIGASGPGSTNLVFNGGTLIYTGGSVSIDRGAQLTGNGAITVQNSATTLGIEGQITGAGNLAKNGSGVLELSGANTYTGGTNVNAGTLRALSAGALGTGGVRIGPTGTKLDLTAVSGSAISVGWIDDSAGNANAASVGGIDLGATTLTINPGAAALGAAGAGAANYAGVITGTGGIVKAGVNIQQFSGCNSTYSGATTINGGVLAVDCLIDGGAASSIGSSALDAGNLVLNGGTLRYLGTGDTTNRLFTLGASATSALDASGTGAVVFSNTAPVTFSSANTAQTVTLTGTSTADNKLGLRLTDNGTGKTGLSKTGAGTWILTNAGSTYTGATSITGGVLGVDKLANGGTASSLGQSTNLASNLVIGGGGTLRYTGAGDTTDRRFTMGVGTASIESSGAGAVVFANTAAVSYTGNGQRVVSLGGTNTGDNIMGATIGNQTAANFSSLAKNGAGKWILTGSNTYTGVTNINAGMLVLGDGGTTGSIAGQTVNNYGVLGFDRSDTLTYGGVILQTGSVQQLGAGKTQLSGTNTYSGGTTISAGTLELGAGGATGSILGNVTNNGIFSFNRSNQYAFTGLVSGTGELRQTGSGVTVLSAANSYLGSTNVMAGTLRINGNQAAATGLTTVFTGATLGGSGTIGGNVLVQNGGVIAPGNSPGTLTINGDLALNGSSVLNMEFGQANVPGGPLNDLINVNGNLTLDGVVNVSVPTGGAFTAGVYRVINYTGALTDNTLNVGTLPAGAAATVQTSVAGQVNLVNTAGQSLFFWDGPAGGKNDSIITGGTGSWRLGGGANEWTNSAGSANSDYQPDAFAVFQGTPGTVTVDSAGGTVGTSGIQFAVGGYTVAGAALNLVAAQTPIRVGDGTPASAGMTATISSVLAGSGRLVKVDDGTLVLSGTNTYTGGTLVSGGVLQISQDANLGAASGGLTLDGGTLQLSSSMVLGRAVALEAGGGTIQPLVGSTVSGSITGVGRLTKGGASVLRLTGVNTYTGGTTIAGGALILGDGVAAGSIIGDVLNNAQLLFNNPGVQTFAGTISGSGQVRKTGAGTEILTGTNTYAGVTTVAGGTLLINGDQSGATGLTSVTSGTLGGSGTIGGNVTVAAGAALAPGGAASTAGTLTIAGDLTLAGATTNLNYEFGQANTPGGTLNDLLKVGGNVDLGGATINVASSAPSFGPGLYRVIDYTGTRTGTLTLGAQPASANFSVQTSVDKQVNLVNTAGLTLDVWDGDASGRNDGDIAGGSGTWQGGAAGGNDNWTLADGSINARFTDSAFAIFTKTGGAVTVDATAAGPINVAGMQFAVDGYTLNGDAVNLSAAQSNVWVGDATANSATITATINARLSGTGGLVKTDAGTLVLTGANDYSGATAVNGGTLVVNGDQSAATGLTTVNDQGVLAGSGILGGGVTVADGGALSPGNGGVGTLTINGDLTLNASSVLNMEFGEANVPGGLLNDLIDVKGGLTLNGVLNVTVSTGGSFDAGIYRLANYTGAFVDNGLALGSTPTGSLSVQTAVAGQVNLVNSAGQSLFFWDGPAGAKNDGAIQGGTGVWRLGGGGNDWTNAGGTVNTDFAIDSFAVFTGAPGVVTVDDVGGAVRTAGIQFAVDGYRVTGDGLELLAPQTAIRVGDASPAGAAMTATVDSVISGAGQLVKLDLGTLVLTAANTYTGGSTITDGTLQLGAGGATGSILGDVVNNGILAFNRSDTATFGGQISGTGAVRQIGAGTTILSGSNSYAGGTTITAGTLQLGDGGATGSILGDVANNSALAFNRSDTVTFGGQISGTGAVRQIGAGTTILSGSNSYSGGTTISAGTLQLGAGGTTGSIFGDVANNGTLAFNRSDTVTFGGQISGTGAVRQIGAGTTILSGANSYTGATDVNAGTLRIDGDQTAATGLTSVLNSATLGGSGIVGGGVAVADGGALAPGGGGVGTLTINGGLSLSGGSTLNYEFGEAGVVGGAFNDLITVGGDLTLDGTINVARSAGGAFNPGLYRVISYSGALTDNGLLVGTLPAAGAGHVQTSVAGQVNLINYGGLTLNFWDGAAGLTFNNAINGGDGVWRAAGGASWTDASGAVNAAYADGAFAIFSAAPGRVTIDNGQGAVRASGLQFASDGYVIGGGALTLTGPQATIVVGDGTAPGAGYTATIGAELTGTAQLTKADLGTLVLTGANSYAGETVINAGALLINGEQSAARGRTSVNGGALGGVGVIGGDVVVGAGGALSPGDLGVAPGMLTINGDLSFAGASSLNLDFGQANVVGGPLNDLVKVGGDLVLDGVLNVQAPAGGAFVPGLYRIADYAGHLTDDGLMLGTASPNLYVQTSVDHQVNLINTRGLALRFWDGDAGAKNNGQIDGDDGVWQATTGNDNWTEDTGSVNAPFSDNAFAVFMGAPGVVRVDNGLGAVKASGLQFVTSGYVVEGQPITLADGGSDAFIRVGDGTAAGAATTATIRSELTGAVRLIKADLGTLILAGANSYTGGTTVEGGVLQISSDANLGAASGGLSLDGATLHTTASFATRRATDLTRLATIRTDAGTTLTLNGAVSGTGGLDKSGDGVLALAAATSYAGATTVRSGALAARAANVLSPGSTFGVMTQGVLDLGGHDQTVAALSNAGSVRFGSAPGATLAVAGDYVGLGGVVQLSTALAGDNAVTDRLVVGGATSGATTLVIDNVGGPGGRTVEGIKVVDVGGASNGVFALRGDYVFEGEQAVIAGAYGYRLYKNGVATPADGDWYLRSTLLAGEPTAPVDPDPPPLYQPGVPVYEAYGQALLNMAAVSTLQQRIGQRLTAEGGGTDDDEGFVWGRIEGLHGAFQPKMSTSGADYDLDSWSVQVGMDRKVYADERGRVVASLGANYGGVSTDIRSRYGRGQISADSYGLTSAATWYGVSGRYLDGQAKLWMFDGELASNTTGSLADDNKGFGYALSLEAGQAFATGGSWSLTPQAQLTYTAVDFDSFTDPFGARVSLDRGDSLRGRLGLGTIREVAWNDQAGAKGHSSFYGLANLKYEFLEGTVAQVSGTPIANANDRLWASLAAGGAYSWKNDRYALHGELSVDRSFAGDSYTVNATAGFRVRW